jgi:glycosyltransferase involved in cell wall biosynthesis
VIKVLVDKNLADKLGAAGQERVEKEFRWEVQAEKLKNILI